MGTPNRSLGLLCILTVLGSGCAQIPHFGRCPDMPVVQNFDAKFYLGKWYEIEKYFTVFELGGGCITAEYSDLGNGTIGVKNTQIQTLTGQVRSIEGTARVLDSTGSAKLGVTFPSVPCKLKSFKHPEIDTGKPFDRVRIYSEVGIYFGGYLLYNAFRNVIIVVTVVAGEAPYWVIGTDYKNYSIVWSCSDFGFMSFRIVWFLSRERFPSETVQSIVYSKLKELQIRTAPLQKTVQDGCDNPLTTTSSPNST